MSALLDLMAAPLPVTIIPRRLSALDLIVGIKNVPLRVLEQHWETNEGAPDSLLVFLSNGRNYSMRFDPLTGYRFPQCFERETEIEPLDTGLDAETLKQFEQQLAERYAEGCE